MELGGFTEITTLVEINNCVIVYNKSDFRPKNRLALVQTNNKLFNKTSRN